MLGYLSICDPQRAFAVAQPGMKGVNRAEAFTESCRQAGLIFPMDLILTASFRKTNH